MDLNINEAYNLVAEKLENWLDILIKMLPNLAIALVVLIVFFVIGKLVRKVVNNLLQRVTKNQTIIDLLETVVGVIVVSIGIFIALSVLQLDGAVTSLLAGAGIIGLALGFAFQDIAANFISGILLSIRHPFGKGDMIESNDYYGYVEKINLRSTIIRTTQGQLVYIPNKDVYGKPFINYTWNGERRIDLACGVSYGDDLEKAQKLAIEAIEELDICIEGRPIQAVYTEFGGSSINFDLRFWIPFRVNFDLRESTSEAIKAVKKKFDENDIMIPFPIRTLDFGIRGGEKLSTMLSNGQDKAVSKQDRQES